MSTFKATKSSFHVFLFHLTTSKNYMLEKYLERHKGENAPTSVAPLMTEHATGQHTPLFLQANPHYTPCGFPSFKWERNP